MLFALSVSFSVTPNERVSEKVSYLYTLNETYTAAAVFIAICRARGTLTTLSAVLRRRLR